MAIQRVWIMIVILALLIILGVIATISAIAARKKGKKRPTDYYALFVMGAIWLPFGILMKLMNPDVAIGNVFFIIGLVYFILGLSHKKEWKKNHKTWKQLSSKEQKWKMIILMVLGLVMFVGLVVFYFIKRGIVG